MEKEIIIVSMGIFFIIVLLGNINSALVTKTYNFTGISNPTSTHKAINYTHGTASDRWNAGTEFMTQYYTNLQTINLVNASCNPAGTNDYCLLRFVFKLSETSSSISQVNFTIIGGENGDDVGFIGVYNWSNGNWVNFESNLSTTYGTSTLNLTDALAKAVIGGTSNNITIIIDDPAISNDGGEMIKVDYIQVKILYDDAPPASCAGTNYVKSGCKCYLPTSIFYIPSVFDFSLWSCIQE